MSTFEELKLKEQKIDHCAELVKAEGIDAVAHMLRAKQITDAVYADSLTLALARGYLTAEQIPGKLAGDIAQRFVKSAPWRIRDIAADRGTEVHRLAEQLSQGEVITIPEELKGHIDSWRRWRDEWEMEFVLIEFTVFSMKYNYAGTGDVLGRSGAHPELGLTLFDYKTSESGIWPDIALQLASIRYAEFIGRCKTKIEWHADHSDCSMDIDKETLPQIKSFAGVQITGEGYQVVPARVTPQTFDVFRAAHIISDWKTQGEKWALDNKAFPFTSNKGALSE